MKIIIAPAKGIRHKNTEIETTIPLHIKKQKKLHKLLKSYSTEEIHDIMKISFKMSKEVYAFYHKRFPSCPAIYSYCGTVFKELKFPTYKQAEFEYLGRYINIMSAYYGVLRYNDGIAPYRLDMTMKVMDISLYEYWYKDIKKYFKGEDVIISLASKEFTKMIDHPNIITIDFVEDKGNRLRRNATVIKQARGKMLHLMIKNKITTIEEIKQIAFDEYAYHQELSTNNNLVFYRK